MNLMTPLPYTEVAVASCLHSTLERGRSAQYAGQDSLDEGGTTSLLTDSNKLEEHTVADQK